MSPSILAIDLSGGEGSRLRPLTQEHSKPALPFANSLRIIDFVLSGLVFLAIERQRKCAQQADAYQWGTHASMLGEPLQDRRCTGPGARNGKALLERLPATWAHRQSTCSRKRFRDLARRA